MSTRSRFRIGGGAGLQALLLLVCIAWLADPASSQIVFTIVPSDTVVIEGNLARFDCEFTSPNPVSIAWRKDDSLLIPSSKFQYLLNSSLLIDPTEGGDNGTYSCVITDQLSGSAEERSATLAFALFLDQFVLNPSSQTVDEDDTLQLFCIHGSSIPPATITWTHNDDVIITSSRIFISSSILGHTDPPQVSSTLVITAVDPGDAGSYRCLATNAVLGSSGVSEEAVLSITAQPKPPSILTHPQDTIVAAGTTATLTCTADGEPLPTLTWTHNGASLTPNAQIIIQSNPGNSILTISSVQNGNAGMYQCVATNSQGTVFSSEAELQLATIGDTFQLQPEDTVAILDRDAIIDCLPPMSIPPAIVTWTKNFAQISNPRFIVLTNGSLSISDVQLVDQGSYHCTATNEILGVSRTSNGAQLIGLGTPGTIPSSAMEILGSSVTFMCVAQGDPPPQITWRRGNNDITDDTTGVVLTSDSITISAITLEDEGSYTCVAVFPAGNTTAQAYLDVLAPPLFVNSSVSLTAFVDLPATLPCLVLPDPLLSFIWRFEGETLDISTSSGLELLANGSLVIASVSTDQEGTFTCEASNSLGSALGFVMVTVLVPTVVIAESAAVTVVEGDTARLACVATGDPTPVLMWYRNGTEVPNPSTPRYQVSSNGTTLTVEQVVEEEDEGVFVCVATNVAGTDQDTVSLSVYTIPDVVASPTTQQLLVGSTATFTCTATGDPKPSIVWLNSASINVTTIGDSRIQVLPNGSLVISDVTFADQQQYICEGSNTAGGGIAVVSLTVLVPPTVTLPPTTTTIQGGQLTLDCSPNGNPTPSISWLKDGSQIEETERVLLDSDGSLVITSVFSSDVGSYTCLATNSVGSASANTVVTVLVVPVIQQFVTEVTVNEGDKAILDCTATGSPQPEVTWFHDSVPLPEPGVSGIQQAQNNSLLISDVRSSDQGEYVCRATNIAGTESATVELRVYVSPQLTALEISITVVEGNRVTLTCVATGDPTPVLMWYRNGTEVPNPSTPRYQLASNGSTLVVDPVRESDEGQFQCMGMNPAGVDLDTVTLTVHVPPTFTLAPTNSTAVESTQHTLTCGATGDPAPLITWSQGSIILSTQGTLLFNQVSRSDSGFYTCTAGNIAGTVAMEIYLDVYYAPSILQPPTSISIPLNNQAQFTCVVDGNPVPLISWLFDGVAIPGVQGSNLLVSMVTGGNSGMYTCVASNSIGETSASAMLTVLFPPSPPTILVSMATGSTSLSVQWAASTDDGGSPITGYVVEYRASSTGGSFSAVSISHDILTTTLVGLTPFTMYDIRVRGENIVGLSDPSSTLQQQTHPGAPAVPGNLRVSSSTASTLTLTWTTPNPLNGQLAAYELQYGNEDNFMATLQSTLIFFTQFTISGLQMDVIYLVRVRASTVSLTGETLWGDFAVLRVQNGNELELPSPSLPTSTSQVTTTVVAMTTEVQPPMSSSQPLEAPTTSAQPPTTSSIAQPPTTSLRISSSLPPSSSSRLAPISSPVAMATPSPTPSGLLPPTVVPETVSLFITSMGNILVYWLEPTSGLDTFDGYQIFISPDPPAPLISPIFAAKTAITGNYSLQGLAHFTMYTITVATYNAGGVGPQTAMATITTPEAVPSAPREVVVGIINTETIIVSWSPPDPPNGIIQDYEIQVDMDESGQLFSSRTIAVADDEQDSIQVVNFNGLQLDSVRYRITVSARTGEGQGPESIPVFVGEQATEPPTTSTSTSNLPSSIPTLPPTTPTLEGPGTLPPSTPTLEGPGTLPPSTPTLEGPGTLAPSSTPTLGEQDDKKDAEYYIIRIVPPVALAIVIVIFLMTLIIFILRVRAVAEERKGAYKFLDEGTFQLQTKQQVGEPVAADELETSHYHVKEALDVNFSFAPPPSKPREEGGQGEQEDDVDEPDIGTALGGEVVMRRDAMQESPSHVQEEADVASMESEGDGEEESIDSQELERPVFQPGDYSYAELDAIRARKARERAKRFGLTYTGQDEVMDDEMGLLPGGGIKETRIGAVGPTQQQMGNITPEASAHMY